MIGAAHTMLARVALGALLETIGRLMAATSRVDPVLRSCITRDLVFEISTDDGVARHWQFDGAAHEVSSHAGGAPAPTSALRFADASVALRVLAGSSVASDAAVAAGQMRIDGSSTQALWFSGLVKRVLNLGRWGVPRQRLPGAYVAHDPHSRAASFITVEPPQHELDRPWRAAWQQRGKLAMVRVPAGTPAEVGSRPTTEAAPWGTQSAVSDQASHNVRYRDFLHTDPPAGRRPRVWP